MEEYYVNKQINGDYIGELNNMNDDLKNNKRVIFTKYGDGEYNCMNFSDVNNFGYNNCDGDKYSVELGEKLRESIIILSNLRNFKNECVYIGKWHSCVNIMIKYYASLYYEYLINNQKEIKDIPFVDYHFCYNYHPLGFKKNNNMYDFVNIIRNSNKFKIVISNGANEKLNVIFNSNFFFKVSNNNWYVKYDNVISLISNILDIHNDAIILLAAGLASKVLIKDLAVKYNNVSFIDIGSGFDLLATKKLTRASDVQHTYNDEYEYYKNILPPNY